MKALALLLIPALAHADAKSEAVALFEQGVADLQAGKTQRACDELAASLAKAPEDSTQVALATCETQLGKLATAWQRWKQLAQTTTQDDLRAEATGHAAELEPRLPHVVVTVAEPAAPGLVVAINGRPVQPNATLPVDPGELVATAQAPHRKGWTQTLSADEGAVTHVDVPVLAELPAALPPVRMHDTRDVVEPEGRSQRNVGLTIATAGVLTIGVSLYFGASASSHYSDAKDLCGGHIDACGAANVPFAQTDVDSARSDALVSTILIAAGGALVVGGAIWYLTAPRGTSVKTALRLTPSLDRDRAALTLAGVF